MADRRGNTAEHPALAQLRGYWEGLRCSGLLPTRAQIDPRGIERALEHAFIAERIAPGVARVRLAGMHLNDILGMEVRGMPLTAFFEPVAREEIARQIERAFSEPAVIELRINAVRGIGRPALTGRLLLLPLRTETGEVARVLGGLACDGSVGRPPRRFRLEGAEAALCQPEVERTAWADAREDALVPEMGPGLAEDAGAFTPEEAPSRHPHLRLVHSSD